MSLPTVKLKDLTEDQRKELADKVLDDYEQGKDIVDQAPKVGVSARSLYRNILNERPEEWRNVRSGILVAELDETKREMKEAKDHLSLARAEKLGNRIAWELERLNPALYGQKQEQNPQTAVSININLRGERQEGVVIEHQPPSLKAA